MAAPRGAPPASAAADGQLREAQAGGARAAAQLQVAADADAVDALQHLQRIARYGDLLDGVHHLAVLEPEAVGAAGVLAADGVEPMPQTAGQQQRPGQAAHQFGRGLRPGQHLQVEDAGLGQAAAAALGAGGGRHAGLARGVAVVEKAAQHPRLDQSAAPTGQALAIEGGAAHAAGEVRVVDQIEARGGDGLAAAGAQKRGALEHGVAAQGGQQATHEARGHAGLEDDRHPLGSHRAGAQHAGGALARHLADAGRRCQRRQLALAVVPGLGLQAAVGLGHRRAPGADAGAVQGAAGAIRGDQHLRMRRGADAAVAKPAHARVGPPGRGLDGMRPAELLLRAQSQNGRVAQAHLGVGVDAAGRQGYQVVVGIGGGHPGAGDGALAENGQARRGQIAAGCKPHGAVMADPELA